MYDHKQGLVKKQALTETEVAELQQLTTLCNSYENLHMRISWEMLPLCLDNQVNNFLYYDDGKLVGYLALDGWGVKERELVSMVHPDYRRKGIGSTLFAAVKDESIQRGLERLVLICEPVSISGMAFVASLGAQYDFSEHEMWLEHFQERENSDDRLCLRTADANDFDAIFAVQAASFGHSDAEMAVRRMVEEFLQNANRTFYLATLDDEPVGCLRLDAMGETIGIYAFGIRPEFHGRGYGRQMLEGTIRSIRAESQKKIMLDVDTTNTRAICLYQSCGFRVKTTYSYYGVDLQLS